MLRVLVFALPFVVAMFPLLTHAADDWQATTSRIDQLLSERWQAVGVTPVEEADDAEFLRRAYIDLTGVIPTVSEARVFLEHQPPFDDDNRRARLIDDLLSRPGHPTHLANIWSNLLLAENNNVRRFAQTGIFENWLREHFSKNTPYDQLVRDLLTANGTPSQNGATFYYTSLQAKPEKLAASTSRIFLGVKIQCAECHDHPFDLWKQRTFWGYAAFFAQLQQPQGRQTGMAQVADAQAGEIKFPDSDEVARPTYLDGTAAEMETELTRREQLADWVATADNPYFARAAVNRVWSLLFGYGIVHPVDDFSEHNPPSHPKVLDFLANDFAAHNFDLRRLFLILANSHAYQLTSRTANSNESTIVPLFDRMTVKSLTAEQVFDCLATATAKRDLPTINTGRAAFSRNFNQQKLAFLAKFESPPQDATEFQASIPQALAMMNGDVTSQATNVSTSDLLIAVSESPFFNNEQRLDVLFLAALARYPTEPERRQFAAYVAKEVQVVDPNKHSVTSFGPYSIVQNFF